MYSRSLLLLAVLMLAGFNAYATWIEPADIKCVLCGTENHFNVFLSSSSQGYDDLDRRPPEMYRSTMRYWVHRCSECGYCARDLNREIPGATAVVKSPEYLAQLDNPDYPKLANSFICESIIEEKAHQYGIATISMLAATWACDDANMNNAAIACRKRAVDLILLQEKNTKITDWDAVLLVDLLRRTGQFEQAQKAIAERRSMIKDKRFLKILNYETMLLNNQDTACHNASEVFEPSRK